jgi:hypothetical protein
MIRIYCFALDTEQPLDPAAFVVPVKKVTNGGTHVLTAEQVDTISGDALFATLDELVRLAGGIPASDLAPETPAFISPEYGRPGDERVPEEDPDAWRATLPTGDDIGDVPY